MSRTIPTYTLNVPIQSPQDVHDLIDTIKKNHPNEQDQMYLKFGTCLCLGPCDEPKSESGIMTVSKGIDVLKASIQLPTAYTLEEYSPKGYHDLINRICADHKDHSKKIIVHVADMCRDGTVEEIVDNLIGLMCALQDRMEDEENNTPCYTIPEGSSKGFVKRLIKTIWMNHKHEFTIAQIRIQIGSNDRIDTPHKVTKTLRTMLKDRKIKWGRAKTVIESYRFELQDRNDKQKVQELGVTILEKHECNPDSQDRIKFSLGDRPMAHFTDGTTTVEKVLELLHFYVKEIENGTIFTNDMVD